MKRLFARHRLDIRPHHLVHAVVAMTAAGADRAAAQVEAMWSPEGSALTCYSVGSGFHLLLAALDLPRGSEVMFSAVTHPDMPRIAAHHGLVPVPVDLDPDTLSPTPAAVARAITAQTRIFVVAHLFGGRVDLAPMAAICRPHRVLLIEDCAQSFAGETWGDDLAGASMFSFGILKTATALGGAVLTVRDGALLDRMREIQRGWPLQTRLAHLKRIAQTAAFVALTRPRPYGAVARLLGDRFDRVVNGAVKAFPSASTEDLVGRLEHRPNAPLLALLRHRLEGFDHARLLARAASGERLAAMLPEGLHVGGFALDHSHWLFPVVAADPDALIAAARAAGFDAARSASSVTAVVAPPERPELEPRRARGLMANLVFLPAYPELPAGALEELRLALEGHDVHARVANLAG